MSDQSPRSSVQRRHLDLRYNAVTSRLDFRCRLLGRMLAGRDRIGAFDDALYFFPYRVQFA